MSDWGNLDKDWDRRLVYADWLEDQGLYLLANGQRWQAKNKKRPLCNSSGKTYLWFFNVHKFPSWVDPESDLPEDVYSVLAEGEGHSNGRRSYGLPTEAEADLAKTLSKLGIVA